MKRKLIIATTISMFIISCSTAYNDPYGRNYIPSETMNEVNVEKENKNEKIIDTHKEKENIVKNEETKEKEVISNELENFLSTLTEEERKEYDRLYNPNSNIELEKPVVNDPSDYKDIKIKSGEEKIYKNENKKNIIVKEPIKEKELLEVVVEKKKEIVKPKEKKEEKLTEVVVEKEKILPKYTKEDYESIKLTSSDVKILNLIKKHYDTLESYDILELKTKELIYIIRKEQDSNISSTKVIQEIHEMIKELKTRSFIIAIERVAKNRRLR